VTVRSTIVVIALCAMSGAAGAQVSALAGAGSRSCAQMQSDIADLPNVRRAYVSWMQGYLSARNTAREAAGLALVDVADFEEQWEWIVASCSDAPEATFAEAVEALFVSLAATAR
jgi:hypothetical protein